ncbi:MAG: 6,7-dimethyl-8-ribityllumazine synthase [Xanthomonadaceae bacterium]|jgi:6,7-dimethyl-8-ribityllumazine synthase|nr:6,7-dimethyl-8-ribityllumazine synthase [Xanthomonadaceae bacterium]
MRQHHQTRAGAARPALERHGVPLLTGAPPAGVRIAVLASTFNGAIVDRLADGALGALREAGVPASDLAYAQVAGAWELPQLAARVAASGRCDAIVALGCVIRGETSHYDVIVNESARGLMQVSLEHRLPVANGVLACEDEDQAWARAGGAQGNKGAEAAEAVLALLGTLRAAGA